MELAERQDLAERHALIERHLYLVELTRQRVVPIIPPGIEEDDLLSEGTVGLVQAANRFDPSRGTRFRTLAITWIRGAMLEYLRRDDWLSRGARKRTRACGEEPPRPVQLSWLLLQAQGRDQGCDALLPVSDDFAPLLVEQIAARQAFERLPRTQQQAIRTRMKQVSPRPSTRRRCSRCGANSRGGALGLCEPCYVYRQRTGRERPERLWRKEQAAR